MGDRERREELAHGGLMQRDGNLVTLGDGSRWWLNGEQWARNEADALIVHDRQTALRHGPMRS